MMEGRSVDHVWGHLPKKNVCFFVRQLEMQSTRCSLKDLCVWEEVNSGKCHKPPPPHSHTFILPSETERLIGLKSTQVFHQHRDIYHSSACISGLFYALFGPLNFESGPNLQSSVLFSQRSSVYLMWTVGWHCLVSSQPDQQAVRGRPGEVWCL